MILFLSFIGLWIGISFTNNIVFTLIITTCINGLLYYKLKKNYSIVFNCFVIAGIIFSFIKFDVSQTYYQGIIVESKTNYFILQVGIEKLYIYKYQHGYEIGDILKISGIKKTFISNTIESAFDFQRYLNNKGIYNELQIDEIQEIFLNPLRINLLKNSFLNKFEDNSKNFVSTLFFSSSLDSRQNIFFEKLHLYRLFNASGIYLYAVVKMITWILNIFFDKNKSTIISYILIFPYLIFNILKIFVIKLIIMFVIDLFSRFVFCVQYKYIERLSLAGLILLIFDKYLAFQESFIISFLLSYYAYFLNNSFIFLTGKKKKIVISFLIWLFFIPFEIYFYNEISLFSFIFQTLFLPISIFINILIFFCLFNVPLFGVVDYVLNKYLLLIKNISLLSFNIYVSPFSTLEIIIYFFILISLIYILTTRCKPLYKSSIVLVIFLCIKSIPFSYLVDDYVAFINVGQGDSTLIVHDKKTVLIDTGGSVYKDIANESLIPFFKKRQIYKLDYVITTHNDFDHIGALTGLKENFIVKNHVDSSNLFPIKISESFIIDNLNTYQNEGTEENDKSLVLHFSLNNKTFLIMGDAPKWVERKIIKDNKNLKCDVLKVGHHGSNTSTSQEFIEFLKPEDAIISVGANNEYGHPHSEVLSILKYYKVNIKRTDVDSTIFYFLN